MLTKLFKCLLQVSNILSRAYRNPLESFYNHEMKSGLCKESIYPSGNNPGSRTGSKITKAFYNNWLATLIRTGIQAMQLFFVADSLAPTFRIMAAVLASCSEVSEFSLKQYS